MKCLINLDPNYLVKILDGISTIQFQYLLMLFQLIQYKYNVDVHMLNNPNIIY